MDGWHFDVVQVRPTDQDIKGSTQMTEDREVWRKFAASPYGPTDH